MCTKLHANTHTPDLMSPFSAASSLSIHLHISATSVMSNKTHTVQRPKTHTLTQDQHDNSLHVPPDQSLCNEAYKAWWGPRAITSPPSHHNLHLFLTGCSRICEKGEGGKGGGERSGANRLEGRESGWGTVVHGPPNSHRLPPECMCGPGCD